MNFLRSVLFDADDPKDEEKQMQGNEEESQPLKEAMNDDKETDIKVEKEITNESDNREQSQSEIRNENENEVENKSEDVNIETTIVSSDSSNINFPSAWRFGDIVKTIASKSEELFNEYREELQEFSSGLKKETEELVEATGHRVKDLPSTLESGAHVAQESLEEVGQTLEEFSSSFWRGTKEIFTQVREAVAMVEDEAALSGKAKGPTPAYSASIQRGKYSRYEALVSAMQRDSSTYCDEPEDTEEYGTWKSSFKLEDKKPDIDIILKENAFMQELQSRIVPVIVEHETFWTRYFYRLHKLQQAEDARADLVKRAANTEEEELTWDVDEEGDTATGSKVTTPSPADQGEDETVDETEAKEVKDDEKSKPSPEASGKVTPSSPVPQAEIKPTQAVSGAAHEEEAISDGSSTGSEWQVVTNEEGPVPAEKTKPVVKEGTESKTDVNPKASKVVEAESSGDVKDTNTKKEKGEDDAEEDWSEWE